MEAEHEEIDPLLEACGRGLRPAGGRRRRGLPGRARRTRWSRPGRAWAGTSPTRRPTRSRSSRRTVTQADWEEIDEKFREGVTFGAVVALVPWAVSEVPASALPDLFARTGGAHRLIWRLTRRRFARREARAFRYAQAA